MRTSLRARLLVLFIALAAAPILALGVWTYVQSMNALESLLGRQTAELAERAAAAISERAALLESDLLLIAENVETQALFSALGGDRPGTGQRAAADRFLAAVWDRIADDYESIDLLSTDGAPVIRLRRPGDMQIEPRGRTWTARRDIRDGEDGRVLGTVVARIRVDPMLPIEQLATRFGERGETVVVDRVTGLVLHHPDPRWLGAPFEFIEDGEARVSSVVAVDEPPWDVIASASTAEFAPPFRAMNTLNLAVVLAVTITMTIAFALMLRRSTHSLTRLTSAADAVGRGDFAPVLPRAGDDEVGRLAGAFAVMVAKIRSMISEVEQSRQMAVLGEFAAHVSHEIRNPLTSIKLNLQSLERDAAEGRIPDDARVPIDITLREIRRLESVVRGVLDLARQPAAERGTVSLHAIAANAIELIRPQAERQHVEIRARLDAERDLVFGAAEPLGSAVLNLLLNALDAMPDGGSLVVESRTIRGDHPSVADAGEPGIALSVRDSGPGVPGHMRDEVFRPFHTGKPGGTGLGLPLARRIVAEHGGRLFLADPDARDDDAGGARFVLELPVCDGSDRHSTADGVSSPGSP